MTKYSPLFRDQEKYAGEKYVESDTQLDHSQTSWLTGLSTRFHEALDLKKNLFALLWCLQAVLLLCSGTMLYIASCRLQESQKKCVEHVSAWSPGLDAVQYESQVFRGSLYHHSAWKGTPRPELDALWHRVGQVGSISITDEEVRRLGKDPDYTIRWPEVYGGGHVASVEVFHHLHCLVSIRLQALRRFEHAIEFVSPAVLTENSQNFLRKSTYRDYYDDIEPSFAESTSDVRRHQGELFSVSVIGIC
jgi:hypothetical protein